jgi:flavodoxin short chain
MKIVYWSGTGNTEKMANLIAEGVSKSGKVVEIINVSDTDQNVFNDEDIIILGCSAMGDEVLEEGEFEPFIEQISSKISGKKVSLFGSYGWGDGKWMRDWEEKMISYGCQLVMEPLIVENEPEGSNEDKCIEFGKILTSL